MQAYGKDVSDGSTMGAVRVQELFCESSWVLFPF